MEYSYEVSMMQPAMSAGMIVASLIWHAIFAFLIGMIAMKMGKSFGKYFGLALIPVVNFIMVFKLAGMSGWWILLIWTFVPYIVAWWKIFVRRGKPGWWILVPIWNFIGVLIIAFGPANTIPPRSEAPSSPVTPPPSPAA